MLERRVLLSNMIVMVNIRAYSYAVLVFVDAMRLHFLVHRDQICANNPLYGINKMNFVLHFLIPASIGREAVGSVA